MPSRSRVERVALSRSSLRPPCLREGTFAFTSLLIFVSLAALARQGSSTPETREHSHTAAGITDKPISAVAAATPASPPSPTPDPVSDIHTHTGGICCGRSRELEHRQHARRVVGTA